MNKLTDESLRLEGIYDSLDSGNLFESCARILYVTNSSHNVAVSVAANIMHRQGKNRSVIYDDALVADFESFKDNYVEDLFKEGVILILNRYLETLVKSQDHYMIKTLIVYLSVKNLYSTLYEL
jgi:hypothetical protein